MTKVGIKKVGIKKVGIKKVGRNKICPCGSGRKFKRCCGTRPAALRIGPVMPAGSSRGEGAFADFEVEVRDASHLTQGLDVTRPLRHFQVTEIVEGLGLWVDELEGTSTIGDPIWIDDEMASYVFDPGNMFSCSVDHGQIPCIPPIWENCRHCQKRIRERCQANASAQ